ncbi:MAG: Hpt domain-containing protein [Thermoguttaceae bacterium]|nr:Hpt domain-containing protein [Thermoguttaceae bacterium]
MAKDFRSLFDKLEAWGAEPREVLEEIFMDNTDYYHECLDKFTHETFLQTLPALLVPEKKEEAIHIVHTMKGNADYLGLFPVIDATMIILKDLRADNISQAIADLLVLKAAFDTFCKIIASES